MREVVREAVISLLLQWRRTAFVIGGAALGIALFVSLSGLGVAASAAVGTSLQAAGGTLIVARPAAGAVDAEIFERIDEHSFRQIEGFRASEAVAIPGTVLISNAIHSAGKTSVHEASVLVSANDFTISGRKWPTATNEAVLSSSLLTRFGFDEFIEPFVILVGGVPTVIIGSIEVPDTIGISSDVIVFNDDLNVAYFSKSARDHRLVILAESDHVESLSRLIPYAIYPAQPERVSVLTSLPTTQMQEVVHRETTAWLNSAAWLGLFVAVGSVGLPLIMAVSERRAEIGLRQALGYPPSSIALQFTIEGTAAAGVGGVLGVGIGAVAQLAVSAANSWPLGMSIDIGITSAAVASGIGLLAGAACAVLAMRISPAESLRPGI